MNLRDTVVKYVTSSIDVEFDTKFTVQHEMAYEIGYELLTDPEELTVKYGGGSYSISGFKMTLQRRKSSFVANFFFPSFLIVLTAFVSFWVPPASIPGRGWVHGSSLSDLKSDLGQILSNLTGFDKALYVGKFFKVGFKSDPKPYQT